MGVTMDLRGMMERTGDLIASVRGSDGRGSEVRVKREDPLDAELAKARTALEGAQRVVRDAKVSFSQTIGVDDGRHVDGERALQARLETLEECERAVTRARLRVEGVEMRIAERDQQREVARRLAPRRAELEAEIAEASKADAPLVREYVSTLVALARIYEKRVALEASLNTRRRQLLQLADEAGQNVPMGSYERLTSEPGVTEVRDELDAVLRALPPDSYARRHADKLMAAITPYHNALLHSVR